MKVAILRFPLAIGAALFITGCANIGPPEPPSLELPKPPSDLRAVRQGDKVTLTWAVPTLTTDHQTVRTLGPTRICRGTQAELPQCGPAVGEAAPATKNPSGPKMTASYTDRLPGAIEGDDPASYVRYAVEVLNAEGRGAGLSNQVRVLLLRTMAAPVDLTAHVTSDGVMLGWTSQGPVTGSQSLQYVYRIYRRPEGMRQRVLAGEVRATGDRSLTFTDSNIEWEKTYEYQVEPVTVVSGERQNGVEVAGDASPDVRVFADDVFPPAVPSGLQAVFSGPGQQTFIDLIWAPDTDVDLAGYNVYRREESGEAVRLNSEPVKAPAYRDERVAAGKTYFYSVTAADARGNESARSEEASEAVP